MYYRLSVGQFSLNLLDALGLIIFGILTLLIAKPDINFEIIGYDLIGTNSLLFLFLSGITFLLIKSVMAILFTRNVFIFLGESQFKMSSNLTELVIKNAPKILKSFKMQEISYLISYGTYVVINLGLGAYMLIMSEFILLFIILIILCFFNFFSTIIIVAIFSVVGVILQKSIHDWIIKSSMNLNKSNIFGQKLLIESLKSYKDIYSTGKISYFASEVSRYWKLGSQSRADQNFVAQIPKYILEITLMLLILLVTIYLTFTNSFIENISYLGLYFIAATRIVPSLLRINTLYLSIKNISGESEIFLKLVKEICVYQNSSTKYPTKIYSLEEHNDLIHVENLNFSYIDSGLIIDNLSLSFQKNSKNLIIGASGSGKSTFLDLLLGIYEPTSGTVLINNFSPSKYINFFPGRIRYVPQDVNLLDISIIENIVYEFNPSIINIEKVRECLEIVDLLDFFESQKDGLNTKIGENGSNLSGGQKQRVGIARALYSTPQILILDESTSSLDPTSEINLLNKIHNLENLTLISVSHEISTMHIYDKIFLFSNGKLLKSGTFDYLEKNVEDFNLMLNRFRTI